MQKLKGTAQNYKKWLKITIILQDCTGFTNSMQLIFAHELKFV